MTRIWTAIHSDSRIAYSSRFVLLFVLLGADALVIRCCGGARPTLSFATVVAFLLLVVFSGLLGLLKSGARREASSEMTVFLRACCCFLLFVAFQIILLDGRFQLLRDPLSDIGVLGVEIFSSVFFAMSAGQDFGLSSKAWVRGNGLLCVVSFPSCALVISRK